MMKKLLALLLLFGIVGCSTTSVNSYTEVSHKFSEEYDGILVEKYEDLKIDSFQVRAEAMAISDGRTYHRSQTGYPDLNRWRTKHICEELYKADCVISREGNNIIYANYEDYIAKTKKNEEYLQRLAELNDQAKLEYIMSNSLEASKTRTNVVESFYTKEDCNLMMSESTEAYLICLDDYEKKNKSEISERIRVAEEIKKRKEQQRIAVIHALKERCISYGFTGSNNIAACVQREAQHDYEIEQKEYELQLARQQILTQQNQQQVHTQVPWYLSILEGVAEGIAEGYKQQALIQTLDSRYERKDIYRYCRPNC